MSNVFVTGSPVYLGQRLIPALLNPGHQVQALVRAGSEGMLAPGCSAVVGNALDASSYARQVPPSDTIVQLVGTPNRTPGRRSSSVTSISNLEWPAWRRRAFL